jgi:hypothetical protein
MRLKNAARMFDDTPVYDAYTGEKLFDCQFSSFNDVNAIGSTSTRRVLSIAPGLQVPERRAVRIFEDVWLIGDGNPDSWKGQVIRQSFNMRKATDIAYILTPGEACLEAPGTQVFVHKAYFKDTVNSFTEADYDPFWNVYVAPVEPTRQGGFLRIDDQLYRTRSAYLPVENLRIAQCDEVDFGPVSATFQTGVYLPVNDRYDASEHHTAAILLDHTKAFRMLAASSEKHVPGDVSALVPQAATFQPEVGRTVVLDGREPWVVVAKAAEHDCWLLHLRHA